MSVSGKFLEIQKLEFENGKILYCYVFVNSNLGIFKVYSSQYYELEYDNSYEIDLEIKKDLKKQTLKLSLKDIC